MGQRTTRKLEQIAKRLDADDRNRLVEFAERLAEDGRTSKRSPESLSEHSKEPSYLATADPDGYERKKRELENGQIPKDMI